jgi:hypothetical protein
MYVLMKVLQRVHSNQNSDSPPLKALAGAVRASHLEQREKSRIINTTYSVNHCGGTMKLTLLGLLLLLLNLSASS